MSSLAINRDIWLHRPLEEKLQNSPKHNTLHSWVIHDPKAEMFRNTCCSYVWKIAAIVTAVAFTIIAFDVTLFMIAFSTPKVQMITAAILLTGLYLTIRAFKCMWNKSNIYVQDAHYAQDTLQRMQKITDVPAKLRTLGLKTQTMQSQKISSLKSLLAQYEILQEQTEQLVKAAKKIYNKTDPTITLKRDKKEISIDPNQLDLFKKQDYKTFLEVQNARAQREEHLQKIALCKLKMAYLLKILQDPAKAKPFNHYFTLARLPLTYRVMANCFNDSNAEMFVKAKTSSQTYTLTDLLNIPPLLLAQNIFSLNN